MRGTDIESICWRVRRIRETFGPGLSQEEFANSLGVGHKSWASNEASERISINSALKVVQAYPDVTLDWIYLGRTKGMAFDVSQALEGRVAPAKAPKRVRG